MDIRDLKTLIRCPVQYEYDKTLLHEAIHRENIFMKGIAILKEQLLLGKSWNECSITLEQLYGQGLRDEWYDFPWLKNREIKNRLQQMQRLYKWLCSFLPYKFELDKSICLEYVGEINGYSFSELSTTCDFYFQSDKMISVILLREYFTDLLKVKHWEKNIKKEMELMFPLLTLKNRYPDKEIEVLFVSIRSRMDEEDMLSGFEVVRGNNVIRVTDDMVVTETKYDEKAEISKLLHHIKRKGCGRCYYDSICHIPVPIYCPNRATEPSNQDATNYTAMQQEAIHHTKGPLRVAAGPGAGKTEVLTARITNLINMGISPNRILAVTFTKRAAKEVLSRMETEDKPIVTTLHALGYRIIRQSRHLIGRKRLVNKVDCMQVLMSILKQAPKIKGLDYQTLTGKKGALNLLFRDFSFIDRNGIQKLKETFPEKDVKGIEMVKTMYDLKYQKASYIMYDEQISLAVSLLQKYPSVRSRVQGSFDYLLIDEAQDLDEMQEKLIRLLIGEANQNIAIYGDADQLIYGFRGSRNHFMVQFHELYPGTKDVILNENFRSTEEILNASNQLIGHNNKRIPLQMQAQSSGERLPILIREFHSNRIGRFIEDMQAEGYAAGDIAIIARTNKELRGMCQMLDEYNKTIPANRTIEYDYPKHYLYQDYTFRVLADLLSVFHGKYKDDMVLCRLLVSQGVKPEKVNRELSLYEDLLDREIICSFDGEDASRYLINTTNRSSFFRAFARIYQAQNCFSLPILEGVKKAVQIFCEPRIDSSDTLEIIEDMIRERSIWSVYELWQYLSSVIKYEDDIRISYCSECNSRVHFLTAHDSKGKEFPVVLVYGIDLFESNDIEEDRRLLYVAMTRAKKRLFLTEECKGKSSLLPEINDKLEILEGSRYA